MALHSLMSARNTVHLTTLSIDEPKVARFCLYTALGKFERARNIAQVARQEQQMIDTDSRRERQVKVLGAGFVQVFNSCAVIDSHFAAEYKHRQRGNQ